MEINQEAAPESPPIEGVSARPRRRPSVRHAVVGLAAAGVLLLTAGAAWAAGDDGEASEPADRPAPMQEMHDSEGMQRMHAELSPELRAEMGRMHDRMQEMHGTGSMMGGGTGR